MPSLEAEIPDDSQNVIDGEAHLWIDLPLWHFSGPPLQFLQAIKQKMLTF